MSAGARESRRQAMPAATLQKYLLRSRSPPPFHLPRHFVRMVAETVECCFYSSLTTDCFAASLDAVGERFLNHRYL